MSPIGAFFRRFGPDLFLVAPFFFAPPFFFPPDFFFAIVPPVAFEVTERETRS
jgi:hypothetical protein